jgi:4'-phosphopantetheinyl transferase
VLDPQEPINQPEDMLTYWCRKESVVKATGDGLRVLMREVVVSPAESPARLIRYPGRELVAWMTDLDLGPSYAAALTVLTAGSVTVDLRSAEALVS